MPSHIQTDDQFWKLIGYVNIYDYPEERPSEFPEFNCMSDDGKFLTYAMGYFEQYTVWPEDYERFPKLTPESQQCMLETIGQIEHPQRDPDDNEAWEAFNFRVLSGSVFIPTYCLTEEELKVTGLLDVETGHMRCLLKEMGGPSASINAITGMFTGDVEQWEVEQRAREAEMVCSDDAEPPQTPDPTP